MILILNDNLTRSAILDGRVNVVRLWDESLRSPLEEFRDRMRAKNPRLRVEADSTTVRASGFVPVMDDDTRYEEALASELAAVGYTAMVAGPALELLMETVESAKFNVDQRRQLISIIRNLPPDDAADMAAVVADVAQ